MGAVAVAVAGAVAVGDGAADVGGQVGPLAEGLEVPEALRGLGGGADGDPDVGEAAAAVGPGGEAVPYILTTKPGTPAYAVILMPGGKGILNPRMEGGKLVFAFGGNFLIRSRELFADGRFVAASTDTLGAMNALVGMLTNTGTYKSTTYYQQIAAAFPNPAD